MSSLERLQFRADNGSLRAYGFNLAEVSDVATLNALPAGVTGLVWVGLWIHANLPGAKTFMVMMDMGTPNSPSYSNTYNPANTDIDLFGLDPYPVRPQFTGGVDYDVIAAAVAAAQAEGIPLTTPALQPIFLPHNTTN